MPEVSWPRHVSVWGEIFCSLLQLDPKSAPVSKGIFFVYVALLQSKLICFFGVTARRCKRFTELFVS